MEEREVEEGAVAAHARYYSTKAQLAELLEVLDAELYERELCENIRSHREDFEASFAFVLLRNVVTVGTMPYVATMVFQLV